LSILPEIEILLATYNGERFLSEQIDSILAQDYANLRILARDDGSDDGTVAILEEYAGRFPDRFRVVPPCPGTGHPKWNFLRLMEASTAEYVCFADQDDVWLPQKLTLTMQVMHRLEGRYGNGLPLLAFTDLHVVNEHLEMIVESYWKLHRINPGQVNHFARLLGQNVVTGCTAMVNRRLVELALRLPDEADMHDSWVALIASAFGAGEPVRAQTVLYRQHDRNMLGAGDLPNQVKISNSSRHEEQRKRWELMERQAKGMLLAYGDELPASKLRILKTFVPSRQSSHRIVVVGKVLWHRMYVPWVRNNLHMLRYLWSRKAAKTRE
jgi:glycosyltransferase involved in cell wall biosynthesis